MRNFIYLLFALTLIACGSSGSGTDPSDPPDPLVETEFQCARTLESSGQEQCITQAGDSNWLIQGNILRSNGVLSQGEVLVVNDTISCVGCDCSQQAGAATASVLTCASSLVTPGLINMHDHLAFAQSAPADIGTERYLHRHEWRFGTNGRTKINLSSSGSSAVQWGELRHVMAGTTSILGTGGRFSVDGMLRNLDDFSMIDAHETVRISTFPMGDSSGNVFASCDSYNISDLPTGFSAFLPHVSEGINDTAALEFACLTGQDPMGVDYRAATTAYINAIAVDAASTKIMADAGMGMIWSPRSNTYLYGTTTPIPVFSQQGGRVALGTDWSVTGSMNLLRELACASDWNDRWSGLFSELDAIKMVTENAAAIAGFDDVIGSLEVGKKADVVIWNGAANTDYEAVLAAGNDDVTLVLRGGIPLYGDDSILSAFTSLQNCEQIDVCGTSKRLCAAREFGLTMSDIATSLGGTPYPLFACGTPANEPSCTPFRPGEYGGVAVAGDADGDGVADASDNCPSMFNPVLPVDAGSLQADSDADGVGDLCDPTPI